MAALMVVMSHLYHTLPDRWQKRLGLTENILGRIFVLGRPMVILFFVLSGFVLRGCRESCAGVM